MKWALHVEGDVKSAPWLTRFSRGVRCDASELASRAGAAIVRGGTAGSTIEGSVAMGAMINVVIAVAEMSNGAVGGTS